MKDWEKFEEIGNGDIPVREEQAMRKLVRWNIAIAAGGLIGFVGLGFFAWLHAPPVGGEWWFYLRILVTIVAAVVGIFVGKFTTLIALIVGSLIMNHVGSS